MKSAVLSELSTASASGREFTNIPRVSEIFMLLRPFETLSAHTNRENVIYPAAKYTSAGVTPSLRTKSFTALMSVLTLTDFSELGRFSP